MKRNTRRLLKWHFQRARNQFKRSHRVRSVLLPKRTRKPAPFNWQSATNDDWSRFLANYHRLVPPSRFCLDQDSDGVLAVLDKFRVSIFGASSDVDRKGGELLRQHAYIDFCGIEHISVGAALVLAAEFDRMRRLTGFQPFPIHLDQWSPTVTKTLYDVGFLKILGIDGAQFETLEQLGPSTEYKILPFVSGIKSTHGTKIDDIQLPLQELFQGLSAGQWLHVYDALVEAMNNANEHAYPKRNNYLFPPVGRWWMTGAVDVDANWMKIVFFDQGITIPRHLPRSSMAERVKGIVAAGKLGSLMFGDNQDAAKIAAAIEVSRTSTGQSGRGLGLGQMADLVREANDGRFRIFSGHGEYLYRTGGETFIADHKYSVGGTLVEWEIRNPAH